MHPLQVGCVILELKKAFVAETFSFYIYCSNNSLMNIFSNSIQDALQRQDRRERSMVCVFWDFDK